MARKFDMADYYYFRTKMATEYSVSENLAGCHICQYPNEELCGRCRFVETCEEIYRAEQEKGSGVYE